MPKLFYILMFIFGPTPALVLVWIVGDYSFILFNKTLIVSNYILCIVLLACARIVGGPERKTRKEK